MKLNKTMHIADKVFEYKNKTEKALNLSKFEAHVDAKFDMLVDALNETKAKVDEPVKMVDEKVDLLKAELEEKLAMLKNKTFGIKEEVEGKLVGLKNMAEAKVEGPVNATAGFKTEAVARLEELITCGRYLQQLRSGNVPPGLCEPDTLPTVRRCIDVGVQLGVISQAEAKVLNATLTASCRLPRLG